MPRFYDAMTGFLWFVYRNERVEFIIVYSNNSLQRTAFIICGCFYSFHYSPRVSLTFNGHFGNQKSNVTLAL